MSYKLKNTALDHAKRSLHRVAPRLQMEPVVAGRRLRLRASFVISDEVFEHNKANLELWKKWGVVDWEKIGEAKQPEAKVEENEAPPPVVQAITHEEIIPHHSETPPAETPPSETKLQPKSPFKGKKQ